MALDRQPIPLPFAAGLDTKTAPELAPAGKLLELENGQFAQGGAISKRPGSKRLAPVGDDIGHTLALFDDELLLAAGGRLYSYQQRGDALRSVGNLRSVGITSKVVSQDTLGARLPDCATNKGITLYAWDQFPGGAGGIYALVVDEATGGHITGPVLVDANGLEPQVRANGPWIYIFNPTGDSFWSRTSVGDPSHIEDGALSVPIDAFTRCWSVKNFNGTLLLAYYGADHHITLEYLTPDGAIGDHSNGWWDPVVVAAGPIPDISALTLVPIDETHVAVLWADDKDIHGAVYDITLTQTVAPALLVTADRTVNHLTAVRTNGTGPVTRLYVFYEVEPVGTDPASTTLVGRFEMPAVAGGSVSGDSIYCRSVGLAFDAFFRADVGRGYLGVVYDSGSNKEGFQAQNTVFLMDAAGPAGGVIAPSYTVRLPVGQCLELRSSGIEKHALPSPTSLDADTYLVALGARTQTTSGPGNTTYTGQGVARVELAWGDERYRSAQLGGQLLLCGGQLADYDGALLTEHGFPIRPEQMVLVRGTEFDLSQIQKGTNPTPSIWQITPPSDLTGDGAGLTKSGARVRPGSYIYLYPDDHTTAGLYYLWFKVDGVGSDPLPGEAGHLECDILSTDNQAAVALKIKQAFDNPVGTNAAHEGFLPKVVSTTSGGVTTTSVQIVSTTVDTAGFTPIPPVMDTQLGLAVEVSGTSTVPEETWVTCPAGKFITGGQWFSLSSSYTNGTTIPANEFPRVCFYFKVDGVAPAVVPAPADCNVVVEVDINSTDTPTQVRDKVSTAIDGAAYLTHDLFAVTNTGKVSIKVLPIVDTGGHYANVADPLNNSVGGSITAGVGGGGAVREYVAVYAWTDARGQLHRSAPSVPLKVNTGAGAAPTAEAQALFGSSTHATNVVSVATLRVSRKLQVQVEVYRSMGNGQEHYRVATLQNDPTVDVVTFTDQVADADLGSSEQLYTDSGELANFAPPPASLVCTFGNRLWLAGIEDDPTALWFSKERVAGYGVAFSGLLQLQVDARGGPITAVAAMDDKLVVFKRAAIFVLAGPGPNAAGVDGSFSTPEMLTADEGCVNPDSVALTPSGLVFEGAKGLCLLTRNLSVTYLGAPVERYRDLTLTSAVVVPKANQVRWTTLEGPSLVYDYLFDQWAAWTFKARHALLWRGAYLRLTEQGHLLAEDAGHFADDGAPVRLKATTGWIKPGNLVQGFGRVYRVLLLARYQSQHRLALWVAYDYADTLPVEMIFDAKAAFGSNAFGSSATYGADAVYGGGVAGLVEELGAKLPVQKCQAVRITLEEVPPLDGGAGLVLVHLALEVGVKRQIWRPPASNRFTGGT